MKKHDRRLQQLLAQNARARGAIDPDADPDEAGAGEEPGIMIEIGSDGPHLYLFGAIDCWWGVSAEDLIEALAAYRGQDVHLHINSPGGDVFEGRAMAAAVVAHNGRVQCHIDGICASAATYPALAGSTLDMTQGGMFMIHESWSMAWGNKAELRKTADLLEQIDSDILADYVRHSGASAAQVQAWIEAETWFTAEAAKTAGFVDAVVPNTKRESLADNRTGRAAERSRNAALWNLSAYTHPPKLNAPAPTEDEKAAAAAQALSAQVAEQLQHNRNRVRLLTL